VCPVELETSDVGGSGSQPNLRLDALEVTMTQGSSQYPISKLIARILADSGLNDCQRLRVPLHQPAWESAKRAGCPVSTWRAS